MEDLGVPRAQWEPFLDRVTKPILQRVSIPDTSEGTWAGGIHDPLPWDFALTNTYVIAGTEGTDMVAKLVGDYHGQAMEKVFEGGDDLFVRRGKEVVTFMVQKITRKGVLASETLLNEDGTCRGASAKAPFNHGALLQSAVFEPEERVPEDKVVAEAPAASAAESDDSDEDEPLSKRIKRKAEDSEDEPLALRTKPAPPPAPEVPAASLPCVPANAGWRMRALAQRAASQTESHQ